MSDSNQQVSQRVRAALQRAMTRIKELEAREREPIAVVGYSCRFPGGPTPETYWDALLRGQDTVREIPDERLTGSWPDGVPRWGSLLDEVDTFDPAFFGISPREAVSLDPQQRLLLEVTWEALERGGIVPDTLRDSAAGVFVGSCASDYQARANGRPAHVRSAYDTTGNMASTASGRISYVLGLRGPAVTLDTACSSSLVSIHLACRSLRARETDIAFAGGVNLILSENTTLALWYTQALSPSGRCKTFDASADGYVRGEGCGMLVLKRLEDAKREGDHIFAIVRGSAVNQDGRSTGLTAPNALAQETLLRDALADAGLHPQQIGYVECHGTGTSLGDPIEVEALKSVFGKTREDGSALRLGAVKTNIGHLEGAAGVAGAIKIILALQHHKLPANLHLRRINPRIKLDKTPLDPLREPVEWAAIEGRRFAGVSSFGLSGTNAHVIFEEGHEPELPTRKASNHVPAPLLLSARTPAALEGQVRALHQHLQHHPELPTVDVAFSLATARTHFEHRISLISHDPKVALEKALATAASSRPAPTRAKLALLFTGQGAQRAGMGKELYTTFPAYRESFDHICAEFDRYRDVPLQSLVFAATGSVGSSLLDETINAQPALFALEASLYRLLESWGLAPDFLLGHSIGELVAAHLGGVLNLEDACRLVAARGRLMQAMPQGGAMASIQGSEEEVAAELPKHAGVVIAAINGPLSTVISGNAQAVVELTAVFEARGRKFKRLSVSHAFHSHHMDGMLDEFAQIAASLCYHAPRIRIISNVTGKIAESGELESPDYWVRHARAAVRFLDGVRELATQGVTATLELGPHGVLTAMAAGCASAERPMVLSTVLRKDLDEPSALASALGDLYCHGIELDWKAYFRTFEARLVPLPTYAFARRRYWLSAGPTGFGRLAGAYPLSGHRLDVPDGSVVHTVDVGPGVQAYLVDHIIYDRIVVPGAFYVATILAIGESHWGKRPIEIRDVQFLRAISYEDQYDVLRIHVHLTPTGGGEGFDVRLASRAGDTWNLHVRAKIVPSSLVDVKARVLPTPGELVDAAGPIDEQLRSNHVIWGPSWLAFDQSTAAGAEVVYGRLTPSADDSESPLTSRVLDNVFALAFFTAPGAAHDSGSARLPFALERLTWYGRYAAPRWTRHSHDPNASFEGEVVVAGPTEILDADGQIVAKIEGFTARRAPKNLILGGDRDVDDLYRLIWSPIADRDFRILTGWTAIIAEGDALDRLASEFDTERASSLQVVMDRAEFRGLPARIVLQFDTRADVETADAALDLCSRALSVLKQWEQDDRFVDSDLILVTRSAISMSNDDDVPGLAQSSLWGLARGLRMELVERRLILVDTDDLDSLPMGILAASDSTEPEFMIREGKLFVPRLVRIGARDAKSDEGLDPDKTVLITGGTGGLGSLIAKHLVSAHGIRSLVLLSRRGPDSIEANDLRNELEEAGAAVHIISCDVSDHRAIADVLEKIPTEYPLGAVIHGAADLDDGTFGSMTEERLRRVFEPKLAGAWNLHVLTAALGLDAFVTFSSIAGVFGSVGQANYAAANAFLDALSAYRRAAGLPSMSLAWGPWAEGGMAARLSQTDQARMEANGFPLLSAEQGLKLLDVALSRPEPTLIPVRLDLEILGSRLDQLPILSSLIRVPSRATASVGRGPLEELAGLAPEARENMVLEFVLRSAAAVLGLGNPGDIAVDQPLTEHGLDSLMAVELRNSLQTAFNLRLPATLLFDYPRPSDLVGMVVGELAGLAPSEKIEEQTEEQRETSSISSAVAMLRTGVSRGSMSVQWSTSLAGLLVGLETPDASFAVLENLAKLRTQRDFGEFNPVKPTCLSNAQDRFKIYCPPSPAPPASPFQYLRMANQFDALGMYSVWSAPLLGYGIGDPLPGNWQTQLMHQREALESCLGSDEPYVILGHSHGGIISQVLAAEMELRGRPPAGVVLVDAFFPGEIALEGLLVHFMRQTAEHLVKSKSERSDHEFLYEFSACWLVMKQLDREPPNTTSPTLYIQCSVPSGGVSSSPVRWGQVCENFTSMPIEADHFEVITTRAGQVTAVISEWLQR